jgi:hypothetical protein
MSRAFDTIDRAKLLKILESIDGLKEDDRRLIRVMLYYVILNFKSSSIIY